jgi:hypothetical protein
MNPVEIEQALSDFAETPFDPIEFPYGFLACFGRKANELKSLRSGTTNKSDLDHSVLLRNAVHICVCPEGEVTKHLATLRQAPETAKWKAKLALATDGQTIEAENIITGETFACDYTNLPDHFGVLLTLAGIEASAEIRNNPIDIKATGRLNRLYIELLRHNEDWGTAERRHDLNQFITRLIFCFFAEDTGIFPAEDMFTKTIETMSDSNSDNTDSVISTLFHAMDLRREDREKAGLPRWVNDFPYVNGALFSGTRDVPKFSRIARSYLIHAGNLNWKEINPDIFGSMIQAVADDEERGSVGMHYTSVPNILKLLNPLFLDGLREQLEQAGDNRRKLANLRNRISRIRVFDPACGSGNFLVIAYKEMRAIEAEVNIRRHETHLKSSIPLSNFRGIEIRDFPTEIARLALIIAEYQCDEKYRSQKDALADFLPLDSKNWIVAGNALRLNWLSICPPTGTSTAYHTEDLLHTPLNQSEVNFENEGGETYICGNPPYKGSQYQSRSQKSDLEAVFDASKVKWKGLDYVSGWFKKAALYASETDSEYAFVSTNSLNQGKAVSSLWPDLLRSDFEIAFCHTSFKWSNLASRNAGVTVAVVGIRKKSNNTKYIFTSSLNNEEEKRCVKNINAYLIPAEDIYVTTRQESISGLPSMVFGNMPLDDGNLTFSSEELKSANFSPKFRHDYIRKIYGGAEYVRGLQRYCLWIPDAQAAQSINEKEVSSRLNAVAEFRFKSARSETKKLSETPFRFGWISQTGKEAITLFPRILSEKREYIPAGHLPSGNIVTDQAYALLDAPIWVLALIASRTHLVWVATVCGKLKTDYRYSNSLGWNTFPIPTLTEKNKKDLTRCAEDILLAREVHFPKTIADLYKPEDMPENLRQAHKRNDETLERIYIGRTFKNDTERLEKLFELYTKMTSAKATA